MNNISLKLGDKLPRLMKQFSGNRERNIIMQSMYLKIFVMNLVFI